MRPVYLYILFAWGGLNAFYSCKKPAPPTGTPIYIEVEELDPQLEKCFSEKLYGKWASPDDLNLHNLKEKYLGKNSYDQHIFRSYNDFDAARDTAGTEKIMVKIYGDGSYDTATTYFQLRRYELEPEGIWTQTLNLGNFRLQDRPNDQINPGKVDEEEICDMMVRFCVKASFSGGY
jgi:hypothetical protein